jgi:hypothetical protein
MAAARAGGILDDQPGASDTPSNNVGSGKQTVCVKNCFECQRTLIAERGAAPAESLDTSRLAQPAAVLPATCCP